MRIYGKTCAYTVIMMLVVLLMSKPVLSEDFVNLSYGMNASKAGGVRFSYRWDMGFSWSVLDNWRLVCMLDNSLALWHAPLAYSGPDAAIGIVSIVPVLRFSKATPFASLFAPFVEAGVGLAVMSSNHFGQRNLGSFLAFQDLVGIGMSIGQQPVFEFAFHYLHYSNANLALPNHGIDILLFSMAFYLPGNEGMDAPYNSMDSAIVF